MKTTRRQNATGRTVPELEPASGEIIDLRARLAEAEETLRAIRSGEVDAVVGLGKQSCQVFSLQGAEQAYRVLIESMNEGALTLRDDKTILYANQRFARMVKAPLEQVIGGSFRRFLSGDDLALLGPLLKQASCTGSGVSGKSGPKLQVRLIAGDGTHMPAQISLRNLPKKGFDGATFSMVVTDMTEARRSEELLRSLTNGVVKAQENERGRVALELHDGITQLLCAIVFHSEALVGSLLTRDGALKAAAMKLRDIAGKTAEEVERISHNLRPSILDHLGLAAALRDTSAEFARRTSLPLKLICVERIAPLPADTELALFRILQEALRNVEKHARAKNVTVSLTEEGGNVQLTIKDDGIGFNLDRLNVKRGLGLLSMKERTIDVGGVLKIISRRRSADAKAAGTEIEVRICLAPEVKTANGA